MFKDDETRLRHILDAAREAVGFIEGLHREDLDKDRKLNMLTNRKCYHRERTLVWLL